jgi:nitroreductase
MTVHDVLSKPLLNRRSIRRFTDKPVPREIIERIVRAGQNAPTGGGQQAYSFILVSDDGKKRSIMRAIGRQGFMEEAPLWLMICVDWARFYRLCETLDLEIEYGPLTQLYRGVMDAMLAAENMVIAAEAMGLGSVFNGGVRNGLTKLAEILKLPENVLPVVLLCIGYPDEEPPTRPRWPLEAILHENEYRMPTDQQIRDYYEDANGRMTEMGYFTGRVSSLVDHWRRRFPRSLVENTEARLRDQLRELNFL